VAKKKVARKKIAPKKKAAKTAKKNPSGRPTKYDPDRHLKIAEDLMYLGANNIMLAAALEIDESTLYRWMDQNAAFREVVTQGRIRADGKVARSMYDAACGYSHEAVHISNYQGEITQTPYTKHYPPDTKAAINWLKNRHPDIWNKVREASNEDVAAAMMQLAKALPD